MNTKLSTFSFLVCCVVLLFSTLYACQPPIHTQPDGNLPEEPASGAVVDKKPDLTVAMFAPDKVLKIEIQMESKDWDAVRTQTRNYDNFLYPNCLLKPFEDSFTYQRATVTINGVVVKDVGVRKKGFVGSIDSTKPSLKIKFDEYVENQEFSGLDVLTLNNNRSDRSIVRQCITYSLFAKAGIPAPRCNFAHVSVNGQNLGLFSHIESVKKRFLARHFEKSDGRLYEGTLSDFREGWTETFEVQTQQDNPDRKDLAAMVAALKLPDSELLFALKKLIDVDRFINFWAMEVLVNHLDGYSGNTNNFYVYNDPKTGLLEFLPWGVDATMLNRTWTPGETAPAVLAKGILARRLYLLPETQKKYITALQRLLDTVWKEEQIQEEINRMEKLIVPMTGDDPFLKEDLAAGGKFSTWVDEVRSFVRNRRGQIKPALEHPPVWDTPLADKICLKIDSEVSGTFSTSFGTLGTPNPFASGKGSLGGTAKGTTITTSNVGATAGIEAHAPNRVVVQVVAQVGTTAFLVAVLSIDKTKFQTEKMITLDGMLSRGNSGLVTFDSSTQMSFIIGTLWSGSVQLSQAGLNQGDPITGTFSGKFIAYQDPTQVCYNDCLKGGKTSADCKKKVEAFRTCTQGGKQPQTCIPECGK